MGISLCICNNKDNIDLDTEKRFLDEKPIQLVYEADTENEHIKAAKSRRNIGSASSINVTDKENLFSDIQR